MKSHQFELCRAMYQVMREQGCPSVSITRLGANQFCGETKDGKILQENIPTSCCVWEMKCKIASQWLKTFKTGEGR